MEVLGDATRTKIIEILNQKSPQTVSSIVTHFHLRQPTISHHLNELKKHGFVKDKKKGLEVFYSLNLKCHKNNSATCGLLK
jgi:ArsR family transcriptional regulator